MAETRTFIMKLIISTFLQVFFFYQKGAAHTIKIFTQVIM